MDGLALAKFIIVLVGSYLIGSIPFGVIVGRLMRGIDVRNYGSGKIGGTNVMRILGTKVGILVIALDVVKAFFAVTAAKYLVGDTVLPAGSFVFHWQVAQVISAIAVLVGHNWPVFLKFRGGRGVASFLGTVLAISWPVALFGFEIFLVVVFVTRYMSMGSIFGTLAAFCFLAPLTVIDQFPPVYLVYSVIAAALVILQHRDNIQRLRAGTERRIGDKVKIE